MRSENELDRAKEQLKKQAEAMCAAAVGKDFSVRQDRNTVVRGKITKCTVARIVVKSNTGWRGGLNLYAVWSIWINGVHHFEVRRIPA